MNLKKKKMLAARTFNVGKKRIYFVKERIPEIKESITKQDMRDRLKDGSIIIRPIKGKMKKSVIHKRKSLGNIRKKTTERKREYILLTRKLRKYLAELKAQNRLTKETVKILRKRIRNREFRSLNYLKAYVAEARE